MIMVKAVGIVIGKLVEGIEGGEKCDKNERQWYDHRCDIVLVIVTKIAYIARTPFLLPLAWLSHPQIDSERKS